MQCDGTWLYCFPRPLRLPLPCPLVQQGEMWTEYSFEWDLPPANGTVVATSQDEDGQSYEACATVLGNWCLYRHVTGEELLTFLSLPHQHLLEGVGFRPALAY